MPFIDWPNLLSIVSEWKFASGYMYPYIFNEYSQHSFDTIFPVQSLSKCLYFTILPPIYFRASIFFFSLFPSLFKWPLQCHPFTSTTIWSFIQLNCLIITNLSTSSISAACTVYIYWNVYRTIFWGSGGKIGQKKAILWPSWPFFVTILVFSLWYVPLV